MHKKSQYRWYKLRVRAAHRLRQWWRLVRPHIQPFADLLAVIAKIVAAVAVIVRALYSGYRWIFG